MDIALLYNRIGKRIIGVGRSEGSKKKVEEIARCYKPGRNIGLQAIYKF